jgi:plastocyanin
VVDRKRLGAGERLFVAAVASAAVIAGALGLAPSPTTAASPEITIVDGAFEPETLTVLAGEPVTWTNRGTSSHTVTFDDGSLDSGPIAPGEAFGHVFEAAGRFAYHCAIHPAMVATIIVKAAPVTAVPSGSLAPTPPSGTLPPNFSPFPSTGPMPTPSPTLAAPATPTPGSGGGDGGGLGGFLGTAAVVILIGGVTAFLVRAFARGRRRPSG